MLQLVKTEPGTDGHAVVRALRAEESLLRELCSVLAAQRDGIARDDSGSIETATHGVSRTVLTKRVAAANKSPGSSPMVSTPHWNSSSP